MAGPYHRKSGLLHVFDVGPLSDGDAYERGGH